MREGTCKCTPKVAWHGWQQQLQLQGRAATLPPPAPPVPCSTLIASNCVTPGRTRKA